MSDDNEISVHFLEKEEMLRKIISEYEKHWNITLFEMYAILNKLIFDSNSLHIFEKVFETIPEVYKLDYYKYLVDSFDNDVPETEFVNFGITSVLRNSETKDLPAKEINEVSSQIKNIRQFLLIRKERQDA